MISIIKCYKDFLAYDKFLLSGAYSRVRPNRKEYEVNSHQLGQIRLLCCFSWTLGMNLVMMFDKKGMLWCLVMFSFASLSIDLIMSGLIKRASFFLFCKVVSKPNLHTQVVLKAEKRKTGNGGTDFMLQKALFWNKLTTKETKLMTSFWCLYGWLWTYFTPFSSVSTVDFEQVSPCWVCKKFYRILENIKVKGDLARNDGKIGCLHKFNF